jgi:hypothetical protein
MPSFKDQLRDEYLNVEASFDHLGYVKEKLERWRLEPVRLYSAQGDRFPE